MSDYSQGKIYKIYIKGIEEVCYIGSTTRTLDERLYFHRHSAKTSEQTKCGSTALFEDGNEVEIALVEDFPCTSKLELETRERYWIEQFPDCVNKNIPTRGWKERWEKNRDHNLAVHKEWVKNNSEHIAQYRAARKEIETQQQKERYDAYYKEKRNERKKERAICDICHKEMNKNSIWTHKNSVHKPKN